MYLEDSISARAEELASTGKGFNRLSISTIVTIVGFVTIAMGLGGVRVWQAGELSW